MKKLISTFVILITLLFLSWCVPVSEKVNISNLTWVDFSVSDIQWHVWEKLYINPEKNYEDKKSIDNLYILIDYLIADFQYEKAAKYYEILIKQTNDWDRKRLLHIIINDLQPTPLHYKNVRQFLSGYVSGWFVKPEDAYYFYFTLDLLDGKFDKDNINALTWEYVSFKNLLWRQFDTYYNYTDSPDYYRTALFAIAYFKRQEFWIAKSLADQAISKNPQYILPYQIKAYVWILTKNLELAKSSLDILLQIDTEKNEWYQFLLGLLYYNSWEYSLAKSYFLQMKSPILSLESHRYMIAIERHEKSKKSVNDWSIDEYDKRIVALMDKVFDEANTASLKSIDYQTLFDWFVYDRLLVWSGWAVGIQKLYTAYAYLFENAVDSCSSVLSWDQFICNYGLWAKQLIDGKWKESSKTLIPLVKKYPQRQIYYIIWVLYKEQWLVDNAKVYFAKALQYVDVWQKDKMSDMMLDFLNTSIIP